MRKIVAFCLTFLSCAALTAGPVKADAVTASNMVPTFRLMYNVDQAEAILKENKKILKNSRKGGNAAEIALAQAAVTDATNLVNTLNVLIARNTELIKAAPPGVINPATYAVNSMYAQTAWCDYINKIKYPASYMNISWGENFINTNRNALMNRPAPNYPFVYKGYYYNRELR